MESVQFLETIVVELFSNDASNDVLSELFVRSSRLDTFMNAVVYYKASNPFFIRLGADHQTSRGRSHGGMSLHAALHRDGKSPHEKSTCIPKEVIIRSNGKVQIHTKTQKL